MTRKQFILALTNEPRPMDEIALPGAAALVWKTRKVENGLVGGEVVVMKMIGYSVVSTAVFDIPEFDNERADRDYRDTQQQLVLSFLRAYKALKR